MNEGVAGHSIVAFAEVPIVGGVVSVTVIVCDVVLLALPQPSTARHLLVTVYPHDPVTVTSPPTCCTVTALQASAAVGVVNDGVAGHSIVAFAEVPIVGGVVSVTVIV